MNRRLAVLVVSAFLAIAAGCKEEKTPVVLSAADNAVLEQKADGKLGIIIRDNLPSLFAAVVVFRSDVFLSQSYMLDQARISVLNSFDKAAILLLNSPDILPLLRMDSVTKMYYLCRQRPLARLHPAFEMEMLRRFGTGKEKEPFPMLIRFQEAPTDTDAKVLEGAGYTILSRTGVVWAVSGPLTSLPRLLENDRIIFFEQASKVRPM